MKETINIHKLNAEFGLSNEVVFIEGKGGLPFIQVKNQKSSALISIYAGQVLSFKPVNEAEDFMFISKNAYFQEGKAIKGGIPICWPWFGASDNPKFPNHGFVRDNFWSVLSVKALSNGDTKIKLGFSASEKTKLYWPYSFILTLDITIGESLTLELFTENTGKIAFPMTEALHTYFNVGNAAQVKVLGLENTEYLDKSENFVQVCQVGAITITEETDHIYVDVEHDLTIFDPVFKRKIKISSSGNKNVVIWNPWNNGSKQIKDLDKDDYKNFLCIEIANATADEVKIQPGTIYRLLTNYSVSDIE